MPEENNSIESEYKRVDDLFSGMSNHFTPEDCRKKAPVKRLVERENKPAMERSGDEDFSVEKRVVKYKTVSGKNAAVGFFILTVICAAVFGIFAVPEILYRDDYNNAVTMYRAGQFGSAVAEFDKLGGFRDSAEMIYKVKYDWALSLYNKGDYKGAMELWTDISGYEDSYERGRECTYLYAGELYQNGVFDEAVALYETILDYKDVSKLMEDTVYQNAFDAFVSGNYQKAITLFSALEDNEDAQQFVIISKAYLMDAGGDAAPDEVSTIMANLGTMDSDLARLALKLKVFTAEKLSGTWKSEDGKYSLSLDRAARTLKIIMPLGREGSSFKIEDDIIYVQNEDASWEGCLLIAGFEPDDVSQPQSVTLYNYFDKQNYTLYKK